MIIFLLPAYNEERNIEKVLRDISLFAGQKGWEYRICISDDGSTDGTVSVIRGLGSKLPVAVVSAPQNGGPGAAFDRGFRYILKNSNTADIIVTMEADNTSDLEILDEMISRVHTGADLVLASCYAEGGGISGTNLYRKILSLGANFLIGILCRGKKVSTFSSFYRCYSRDILKRAYDKYGERFISEKGFACAVEILLKMVKFDIRVEEVPMHLRGARREGKSKMKTMCTILSYLRLFIKEVFTK